MQTFIGEKILIYILFGFKKKHGWLLAGEEIKAVYPSVQLVVDINLPIKIGILYITNYQIIFTITTKKVNIYNKEKTTR